MKPLSNIRLEVCSELFIKQPDSSELGQRIVSGSIELIHDIGFEQFTFKKLGEIIGSPESSIYRYFANKHLLLVYLTTWYWRMIEYKLVLGLMNMPSPEERLLKAISIIIDGTNEPISKINEDLLRRVIITESTKAFHTKNIDQENQKGFFEAYKQVVERLSQLILKVNPKYSYAHMLAATVIDGALQQKYLIAHIPSLTDKGDVVSFYQQMVFKTIA